MNQHEYIFCERSIYAVAFRCKQLFTCVYRMRINIQSMLPRTLIAGACQYDRN